MNKILTLYLALVALGCKVNDAQLSPPPPMSIAAADGSIAGYLEALVIRTNTDGSYADNYEISAGFYDTTGTPVPGGAVVLNNDTLVNVNNVYRSRTPVMYNTAQIWQVSGSAFIPSFTDTITGPNNFQLTSPSSTSDTLSKAAFTITYEDPGTDSVIIYVRYDSMRSVIFDTSVHGNKTFTWALTANTGSHTFSPLELSSFANKGIVHITVFGDKKQNSYINGRAYVVRAATAADSYCFIKN